jgi:hypothetical protein
MWAFVAECRKVRLHSSLGPAAAKQDLAVLDAERSFPEPVGGYQVGPQAARRVKRKHGPVWHALVAVLDGLNVRHSNSRALADGGLIYERSAAIPFCSKSK